MLKRSVMPLLLVFACVVILVLINLSLVTSVFHTWAQDVHLAGSTYEAEIVLKPNHTLSQEGDYIALTIPPNVYKHAKGDLSDLRVLNEKGEQVPYAFLHTNPSYFEAQTIHTLKDVEARREKLRDVYDFKTESTLSQDILINGLDIWVDQNEDYLFEVIIWGSYDGLNFEKISSGTIYRVKANRNAILDFHQSYKYSFYRIETNQPTPELVALRISGILRTQILKTDTFKVAEEVSFLANFTQSEVGTKTHLTVSDVANLPIRSISLETKALYRRSVTVNATIPQGSRILFEGEGARFNLENGLLIEPVIDLNLPKNSFETLEIKIENKDDTPLKIDGIRVTYQPDQLVFKILPNQTYRLSYGDFSREVPHYDLPLVVENLQALIVGEVTLGSIVQLSTSDEDSKLAGSKLMFNVAISVAGLLLAFISLIALKNNKKPN